MSHRPTQRPAISLTTLAEKKALGEPIVMVTAYDFPSAQVAEEAGVDVVLVGDSGAMTVLGYPSTVPVKTDELLMLAQAVRRGLKTPLLVGDMPFGSYEVSNEEAIRTAQRFIKEAGCDAVKIERGGTSVERTRALVGAGIPVMGHVGLTPQTATALGGYRSQGRTAERALAVVHDALALQDAGCFAIVFEAIPSALTEAIMPRMEIPVIGIGAGPAADGQVLVFHDLLGIYSGHAARFVKRYASVRDEMIKGVSAYADEVRARRYPEEEHGYTMAPDEIARLARAAARADRRAVHGRPVPLSATTGLKPQPRPPGWVGRAMTRIRRLMPSPAMAVALLALFMAMGGSAYALVVTSGSIKNNTIRSEDVRNGGLLGKDFRKNGVGGGAIKESSLGTVPAAFARSRQRPLHGRERRRPGGPRSRNDLRGAHGRGSLSGDLRREHSRLRLLRDHRRTDRRGAAGQRPDHRELTRLERERRGHPDDGRERQQREQAVPPSRSLLTRRPRTRRAGAPSRVLRPRSRTAGRPRSRRCSPRSRSARRP